MLIFKYIVELVKNLLKKQASARFVPSVADDNRCDTAAVLESPLIYRGIAWCCDGQVVNLSCPVWRGA